MSIELAEQLKGEYTDQFVVVDQNVPELRRFLGKTGTVKTVNMSCRVLVEFDGSEDIGWYDIDPRYLTIVDAPVAQEKPKAVAKPVADKPVPKAGAAKTEAPEPAAKASPLDMIRSGAAGGKAPAPAEKKKPAASGGSPLDAIRSGSGAAPAPTAEKKPAGGGESPLDMIRSGASGSAAKPAAAEKPAAPASGSPLDMIRAGAAPGAKVAPTEAEPAKAEVPKPKPKSAPAPAPAPDPVRASRLTILERLKLGTTDANPPGTEAAAPAEAAPLDEAPAPVEESPPASEEAAPAEEPAPAAESAPAEDMSDLSVIERIRRGTGG